MVITAKRSIELVSSFGGKSYRVNAQKFFVISYLGAERYMMEVGII